MPHGSQGLCSFQSSKLIIISIIELISGILFAFVEVQTPYMLLRYLLPVILHLHTLLASWTQLMSRELVCLQAIAFPAYLLAILTNFP